MERPGGAGARGVAVHFSGRFPQIPRNFDLSGRGGVTFPESEFSSSHALDVQGTKAVIERAGVALG